MAESKYIISHPAGLHARPASMFVKTCNSFPCDVRVKNLTTDSKAVNAKSVLAVLTLGVDAGHEIQVNTEGEQENEVLAAIKTLVESNFGELV